MTSPHRHRRGIISSATGSFDTLTNVTSESGPIGNAGASHADTYTLQMNTDFFETSVCNASTNATCRGWEQFIFENNPNNHRSFIQYWLIYFGTTCPANFQSFPIGGGHDDCVQLTNLLGAVSTTAVPVTNLGQVTLTGAASAGADSVIMTIGGTAFSRAGDNSVNASSGWRIAEFNVLGDGGDNNGVGGTATFNNNASLVTRTRINYGGNAAPNCVAQGFTAEKNNLSFGPSLRRLDRNRARQSFSRKHRRRRAPSNCAAATSVGDTHLTTLSGLLYDFQATGDFELLESKSGFVVQNRQVSGAPTWPNASVNSAIAAQVGKTKVAVCLAPQRVVVERKSVTFEPGQSRALGRWNADLASGQFLPDPRSEWRLGQGRRKHQLHRCRCRPRPVADRGTRPAGECRRQPKPARYTRRNCPEEPFLVQGVLLRLRRELACEASSIHVECVRQSEGIRVACENLLRERSSSADCSAREIDLRQGRH